MTLTFSFDFEKAKAALLHLARKEITEFTKYKALKLLFLADREHLFRFGRPITGDSYDALPYGPVPSHLLSMLGGMEAILSEDGQPDQISHDARALAKSFVMETGKYPTYRAIETPDLDRLSESDIIVLDKIADEFGNKSFEEIYNFTHAMKAYATVWQEGSTRRKFPMKFEDFFLDAPDKLPMLEEMLEDQAIREAFPEAIHA